MKNILLTVALFTMINISSYAQGMNMFNQFHDYFAKHNWKKLEKLLSDNFELIDYTGNVIDQKTDYLNFLKNWSGIMGTKWKVIKSSEKDGHVYSVEQDWDIFNITFYNTPPLYIFDYEFSGQQIKKLTYDTIPGHHIFRTTFDTNYQKFIKWAYQNYSKELPDLSSPDRKKSAKAYIKLLKIYAKY